MLHHLNLLHKYMIDKISIEESQELLSQLKLDPQLKEEFNMLKALKKAVRYNIMSSKMNYLKHIEKTLKAREQSGRAHGNLFSLLLCLFKSCA